MAGRLSTRTRKSILRIVLVCLAQSIKYANMRLRAPQREREIVFQRSVLCHSCLLEIHQQYLSFVKVECIKRSNWRKRSSIGSKRSTTKIGSTGFIRGLLFLTYHLLEQVSHKV